MDITPGILNSISRPSFSHSTNSEDEMPLPLSSLGWDQSSLNPQKRINNLDCAPTGWRIDGANMFGRQLYAVPEFLLPNVVPLGIYVYLPNEDRIPLVIRDTLQYSSSVVARDGPQIASMGISRLVCRALENHCRAHPEFMHGYSNLPFASEMYFESIQADPAKMELQVAPAYEFERTTKPLKELKRTWRHLVVDEAWPESIDVADLRLQRVLHDSVSVVTIAKSDVRLNQEFVFKYNVKDISNVYNELKFLLRCPEHAHILSKPLFLVTKRSSFGGKQGLYGFILPYYPLGTLRNALVVRRRCGLLALGHQVRWTKQVISAIRHVQEHGRTFYCDLRPDNVLIVESSSSPGDDNVLLIDFEQRGNWYEWCAPEIRYRKLGRIIAEQHKKGYLLAPVAQELLHIFGTLGKQSSLILSPNSPAATDEFVCGNLLWAELTPIAREKAMIYTLGLFMYCVFEGVCNPKISLTNAWIIEPDIEFPRFERTPKFLRHCIRACTDDAKEWNDGAMPSGLNRLSRRGSQIVALSDEQKYNGMESPGALPNISTAWEGELEQAIAFFTSEDWLTGRVGQQRPTLADLANHLEDIERHYILE